MLARIDMSTIERLIIIDISLTGVSVIKMLYYFVLIILMHRSSVAQ